MFLKFIEKPVLITTPPPLRTAFVQRPTDLCIHFTGSAQSAVLAVVRNKGNGRGQTRKEYRVKTVTGVMLNNMYLWDI